MPVPRVKNAGISGIAVTFGGLALWFVYAGIRDVNPITGLGVLLRGETPPSRSRGEPYAGPGTGGGGNTVGAGTAVGNVLGPVSIDETTVVEGIRVHKSIAGQVGALVKDARKAGLTGIGGGGWRSSLQQKALRITNGCTCSDSSSCCRVPTAPVGKSMHERGLAIDFTYNGSTIGKSSPVYAWLVANASRYGLKNLPSEAWHWSTTGT
jgi:hypothetical protein